MLYCNKVRRAGKVKLALAGRVRLAGGKGEMARVGKVRWLERGLQKCPRSCGAVAEMQR
jgi:hypothetical protein